MAESDTFLGTKTGIDLRWGAVALAALTGSIHVYVGITRGRVSLLLAGLGFFGAIGAFLAGYRHRTLYLAGIGYVLVQIVLWLVFQAGEYTLVGVVDKTVQIVLVALLVVLYRSDRPV